MNKSLYYASRVVHDPVKQEFVVECRRHWYSLWVHSRTFAYSSNSTYLPTEGAARQNAEADAQRLVSMSVVWQSSRTYG